MERSDFNQFGDKNMMLTLEQDTSMADSLRSFKKKKLEQINKPISKQKEQVDIQIRKSNNIMTNENMKLQQKPFNISNTSFKKRQIGGKSVVDDKGKSVVDRKDEYESTIFMSEQQDIEQSILLEDEQIEQMEKNKE